MNEVTLEPLVAPEVSSGLLIRPGDTVLLGVGLRMPDYDVNDLVQRLQLALPGVKAIVVSSVDTLAVYRPDVGAGP